MTKTTALPSADHRFFLCGGFPADSAFLEGHFPGNPIVPAAVILGYLAARLAPIHLAIARITRVKFTRILRPAVSLEIMVVSKGDTGGPEFRAYFHDPDGIVASANLILRPTK